MDDLNERDKLQLDIEQIHQVLSADEGSSDEDDELETLDENFVPDGELQIIENNNIPVDEIQQVQELQQEDPPIVVLLDRNRDYQQLVDSLLNQVRQALENNKTEQKEVESRLLAGGRTNYDGTTIDKKPINRAMVSFFKPYFRDERGSVPPNNAEATERNSLIQQDPFMTPRNIWSNQELTNLKEGVRNDRLRRIQQPLWNRRELLENKLTNPELEEEEKDKLKEQIEDLEDKIETVVSGGNVELDNTYNLEMDWMRISSMDLDGERTPTECKQQWEVLQNDELNKANWTTSEEEKLVKLVKKYKERDWETIASKLGTGRSAFQCIQHFRQNLDGKFSKKFFTPEEDKQMLELVEKFRVGNYVPYTRVAYFMEGFTHKQVCMHWTTTLNPEIKTGRWSKQEDDLLREAVNKYGAKSWPKIAGCVPGRTFMQARDRWCLKIAPSIKRGSWDPEEDLKMIDLIIKHGLGNWKNVAADMASEDGSRTSNALLIRFRNMVKRLRKERSKEKGKDSFQDDIPTEQLLEMLKQNKEEEQKRNPGVKYKRGVQANPEKVKQRIKTEDMDGDENYTPRKSKRRSRKSVKKSIYQEMDEDTEELPQVTKIQNDRTVKSGQMTEPKPKGRGGRPRVVRTSEQVELEENIIELLKPSSDLVIKKSRMNKKPKEKSKVSNKAAYAMLLKVYDVKVKEESKIVQNMLGVDSYKSAKRKPEDNKPATPARGASSVRNSVPTPAMDLLQNMMYQKAVPSINEEGNNFSGIMVPANDKAASSTFNDTLDDVASPEPFIPPAARGDEDEADRNIIIESMFEDDDVGDIGMAESDSDDYEDEIEPMVTCDITEEVVTSQAQSGISLDEVDQQLTTSLYEPHQTQVTPSKLFKALDNISEKSTHLESEEVPEIPESSMSAKYPTLREMPSMGATNTLKTLVKMAKSVSQSTSSNVTTDAQVMQSAIETLGAEAVVNTSELGLLDKQGIPVPVALHMAPESGEQETSLQQSQESVQNETNIVPSVPAVASSASGQTSQTGLQTVIASTMEQTSQPADEVVTTTCEQSIHQPAPHQIDTNTSQPTPSVTPILSPPVPTRHQMFNPPAMTPPTIFSQQVTPQKQFIPQPAQQNISTPLNIPQSVYMPGQLNASTPLSISMTPVTPASTPGQPFPMGFHMASTPASTISTASSPLLSQLASVVQQGGQLQPIQGHVGAIPPNALGNMQQVNPMQQNMIVVGTAPVVPIFIPGLGNVYGYVPGSMQLAPAGLTGNQMNPNISMGNVQLGAGGIGQSLMPVGAGMMQPGVQPMMGMIPGAGLNPGVVMSPGVGMIPGAGLNPGLVMSPGAGMIPGLGLNQGLVMSPGAGMIPGGLMNPGAGLMPGMGMATPGMLPGFTPGNMAQPVVNVVSQPGLTQVGASTQAMTIPNQILPQANQVVATMAQAQQASNLQFTTPQVSSGTFSTPVSQHSGTFSTPVSQHSGTFSTPVIHHPIPVRPAAPTATYEQSHQEPLAQVRTNVSSKPASEVSEESMEPLQDSSFLDESDDPAAMEEDSDDVDASNPPTKIQIIFADGTSKITSIKAEQSQEPKRKKSKSRGLSNLLPSLHGKDDERRDDVSSGSKPTSVYKSSKAKSRLEQRNKKTEIRVGSLSALLPNLNGNPGGLSSVLPSLPKVSNNIGQEIASGTTWKLMKVTTTPSRSIAQETMTRNTGLGRVSSSPARNVNGRPAQVIATPKSIHHVTTPGSRNVAHEGMTLNTGLGRVSSSPARNVNVRPGQVIATPKSIHHVSTPGSRKVAHESMTRNTGLERASSSPARNVNVMPAKVIATPKSIHHVSSTGSRNVALGNFTRNTGLENMSSSPSRNSNILPQRVITTPKSTNQVTASVGEDITSDSFNDNLDTWDVPEPVSNPNTPVRNLSKLPQEICTNQGIATTTVASQVPITISLNQNTATPVRLYPAAERQRMSPVVQPSDNSPSQRSTLTNVISNIPSSPSTQPLTTTTSSNQRTTTHIKLYPAMQSQQMSPAVQPSTVNNPSQRSVLSNAVSNVQPSATHHTSTNQTVFRAPSAAINSVSSVQPGRSSQPQHIITSGTLYTAPVTVVQGSSSVSTAPSVQSSPSLYPLPNVRPTVSVLPPVKQSATTTTVIVKRAGENPIGAQQSNATPVSIISVQRNVTPDPITHVLPNAAPRQGVRMLRPGNGNGIPPPQLRPNLPQTSFIRPDTARVSLSGTAKRQQVRMIKPVVTEQDVGMSPTCVVVRPRFSGKRMPSEIPSRTATSTITSPSQTAPPPVVQRLAADPQEPDNPRIVRYGIDRNTGKIVRGDSSSLKASLDRMQEHGELQTEQRLRVQRGMAELNQMAENVLGSDVREKLIPLLPPNLATLMAMKKLLLQRKTLEKSASSYQGTSQEKVHKKYKGYIASRSREDGGESSAEQDEISAGHRGDGDSQPLAHVLGTQDFKRLQERFMSVFAWPALLSTVPPRTKSKTKGRSQANSEQRVADKRKVTATKSKVGDGEPSSKLSKVLTPLVTPLSKVLTPLVTPFEIELPLEDGGTQDL